MSSFPEHRWTKAELSLFKKLSSPQKIQDFLLTLPMHKENSVRSVRSTIATKKAHCLEGALLAATALWRLGYQPLLLDLKTSKRDTDHVVAIWKEGGRYGALSKTSHAVLRYRDPIYKSIRELAMSFFHEYFLNSGEKTLQSFSTRPFRLSTTDLEWLFSDTDLYELGAALDDAPHEVVAPKNSMKRLRKADPVERKAANVKS